MSQVREVLLAERDRLRDELTRVDRMLAIASEGTEPDAKPPPQKRERRAKQKQASRNNKPSETMMVRVAEYVNGVDGPLRSRQVADALGVSQSSAGKTLKALAKGDQIEYLGTLKDVHAAGRYPEIPAERGKIDLYGRKVTGEAPAPAEVPAEPVEEPAPAA